MKAKRTQRDKDFKFKVAIEAIKGEKQISELASEYGVHPQQITQWKKELLEKGPDLFSTKAETNIKKIEMEREALYKTIGHQQVRIDWLKKNAWDQPYSWRRGLIQSEAPISISEQCRILGVSRSTYYYEATGESQENLEIMRRIDELYTDNPTWGSRKLRDRLRIEGKKVNRKRIQRLMHLMGLETLYPKRKLSRPHPGHHVYPYLLRGIEIDHPDMVWCTDITYIRLKHGFVYLVAILDWYSRKVLSWELSNTLDSWFCVSALDTAMRRYGKPEIFNTDQGSQFTSEVFTEKLLSHSIRISMDGKGRALDNVVVERFWRSLKYEEVYLKEYNDVKECREGIARYIEKYNCFRPHSSIDGTTPNMAYRAA